MKFGPVTVELPKSVKALDLRAKLSVSLSVDGTRLVRVSLTTGGEYDVDKKSFTGSAGLKIETIGTVCSATSPEAPRAKIAAGGENLKKVGREWQEATDAETRLKSPCPSPGRSPRCTTPSTRRKAGCKQ